MVYTGNCAEGELQRNNRAMTGGRREDDWYCTYLEEGSCLAHCYWDFLTAVSLQTHREMGGREGVTTCHLTETRCSCQH